MQLADQVEAVAELARRELFVYLNPEFQQWQQPISLELQRMKASGEMASIIAAQEQLRVDAAETVAPKVKVPAAD